MLSPTPVGPRPAFFLLIAFLHALLGLPLVAGFVGGTVAAIGGFTTPTSFSVGSLLGGVVLVALVEFIAIMTISIVAQFFNAVTLFGRALRGHTGVLGTVWYSRRYIQLLPNPTTPWSRFWSSVQENGWKQWRADLAILACILVPFTGVLFPLPRYPLVFLPIAVVLLAVAGYLIALQLGVKREPTELERQAKYEKGLAYRERKRVADVARLKDAALAPAGAEGPKPTPFDLWVAAEIEESFRADLGSELAIRNGDALALASRVNATAQALGGRVDPDTLRDLVHEQAQFHRKKAVRKTTSKPA